MTRVRSRGATVVVVVLSLVVAVAAGLGVGAMLADQGTPDPTAGGSSATSTAQSTSEPGGSLTLAPSTTAPRLNQRFTLSGRLVDGGSGVRLVVQRRNGSDWQDFPASTTTKADGSYSLEVAMGRKGENAVRVTAPASGAVSEPVTLTIG